MTFKTRMSVLVLSTPVLAFVLVGGLMGADQAQSSGQQTYQHLRVFDDVVDLVLNNYVGDVQVDKVMDGAMRGLADGLDPDSAFLTPGQVKAVEAGEAAPDGDVGIELTRRYYLYIIAARDGSPAQKAGLRTADTIRAIDGKPTRDMSVFEGTRVLRGKAGHEGHAHDHPGQRRRSARGRAGAGEGRRAARHEPADGLDGLPAHRLVPERRRRGAAQAGGRPREGRREESHRRRAADRRGAARERHRGRTRLHQVGHARHQSRPRKAGDRANRSLPAPETARSICRPRCSSRRARQGPASSSSRR